MFFMGAAVSDLMPLGVIDCAVFHEILLEFVGLLVYWERAAYCNSEPKKDD